MKETIPIALPVTMLSLTSERPHTTSPSAGTVAPGSTLSMSPTWISSASISTSETTPAGQQIREWNQVCRGSAGQHLEHVTDLVQLGAANAGLSQPGRQAGKEDWNGNQCNKKRIASSEGCMQHPWRGACSTPGGVHAAPLEGCMQHPWRDACNTPGGMHAAPLGWDACNTPESTRPAPLPALPAYPVIISMSCHCSSTVLCNCQAQQPAHHATAAAAALVCRFHTHASLIVQPAAPCRLMMGTQ